MAAAMPRALAVFDFDWTLFFSPLPPMSDDGSWWKERRSLALSRGQIHERANRPIVSEARSAQRKKDTLFVILTGRHPSMCSHVNEIVTVIGLQPDFLLCVGAEDPNDIPGHVRAKTVALRQLLEEYPSIQQVTLYDDLPQQFRAFEREISTNFNGVGFSGTLVSTAVDKGA